MNTRESPHQFQSHAPQTPQEWATYLRRIADPIIKNLDPHAQFQHAQNKPLMLTYPLLHHIYQTATGLFNAEHLTEFANPTTPAPITANPQKDPDHYLWWALLDPTLDPLKIIDLNSTESLIPQESCTTIEVWTETELAALHAFSHHVLAATHSQSQALATRLNHALHWHIENTQPDNATNHPWAVQAFLSANTLEAQHFAETLINNCQVQNAYPDPLSAWILIDAATALVHH